MADNDVIPEGQWGAGLTPEELAQMQRVQSSFVNRVYARPYGKMIRISLGELVEGKTSWHTAIAVTPEDLLMMCDVFLAQATWALNPPEKAPDSAPQEPGDGSKK